MHCRFIKQFLRLHLSRQCRNKLQVKWEIQLCICGQIISVCNSERMIKIGLYLRKLCLNKKGSSFLTHSACIADSKSFYVHAFDPTASEWTALCTCIVVDELSQTFCLRRILCQHCFDKSIVVFSFALFYVLSKLKQQCDYK